VEIMDGKAFLGELTQKCPSLRIRTDPDVLEGFRRDHAPAALTPAGMPLAVISPRTTSEVGLVVAEAGRAGVPIVARGAGSGLSGGSNALEGALTLDLSAMNRILDVNEAALTAVVQPGVLNADLKSAVAEHQLWYAPDPASAAFCTIGGNVATNAGGLCCVKYGVTRDAVLGLEVVLADGQVARLGRRTRKGVAGYDLVALLVGSEGTLGVITEITVRLIPLPPPATTLVAGFFNLPAAGQVICDMTRSLSPSLLEIIDVTTLRAIETYQPMGLDESYAALVLAQSDAPGGAAAEQAAALAAIAREAGAEMTVVSSDPGEAEMLLQARRLAFTALEAQGVAMLDDVSVPLDRIADLLAGIERVAAKSDVTIGTFGHAGDGNMHPTIVTPHGDAAAEERGTRAFDEVVRLALDLGGTVTGEHGVGSLKLPYLETELGTSLEMHRRIRAALDPQGLFNPGRGV
jgi:glycolate oxidase